MLKQKIFRKPKIGAKFLSWFLLVALVPLAFFGYVSYRNSIEILKKEVTNNLIAIADNKARQIETYIIERKKNVTTLARTPVIIDAMEKISKILRIEGVESPEYGAIDKQLRPFLAYYKEAFGFSDLYLVSFEVDTVFSVTRGEDFGYSYYVGPYKYSELTKAFGRAKTLLETEVSDFEHYSVTNEPAAFIAAPVFRRGSVIGVVVFQMSNEEVYALAQDYTGLGETGETVIASKKGGEAVFVTPLRHDLKAAFRRKIPIGSGESLAIQEAVKEGSGSGIYVDYRGKEVLGVWRYLPSVRWAMVVKIDTDEAFRPIFNLRKWSLAIGIITVLAVIVIALLVSRSISNPIIKLTNVTRSIAGGDLTSKIEIKSEDEIGQLAASFNKMTEDLKRARDSLEEHATELEKVNKELDSFVYTASHDLRAPLRGITSFAQFLEADYRDKFDEEGKDYLNEIRKGVNRMNDLIEDLLALSRISRIKNPYEDVSINDLINSVIDRIKFDIKDYKVDLKIQENLPTIRCDRIKMAEVFLNLINNGVKFSHKAQENPKVEIGYADKDEFHEFFVKDNGIGIDPKYHQQIFDIFKRLHTSREYTGTGAGLSIVKRVIDDHGGHIWIESEPGKGAAFYFTIPKALKE